MVAARDWAGSVCRRCSTPTGIPEHTGSNEALRQERDPRIVAHERTKEYLGIELFVEWQHRTYKATSAAGASRPGHFTSHDREDDGRERSPIEYGHLGQAHTDGDIYVFVRGSNVLMAGDVLTVGTYPIADYTSGGWLGGLASATKTMLDLTNADTRVPPGTGPVQTRGGVCRRTELHARGGPGIVSRKMMKQGMGSDDHARRGPDQGVRRDLGRSQTIRHHRLSRYVASRARAWRHCLAHVGQRSKGKG